MIPKTTLALKKLGGGKMVDSVYGEEMSEWLREQDEEKNSSYPCSDCGATFGSARDLSDHQYFNHDRIRGV